MVIASARSCGAVAAYAQAVNAEQMAEPSPVVDLDFNALEAARFWPRSDCSRWSWSSATAHRTRSCRPAGRAVPGTGYVQDDPTLAR